MKRKTINIITAVITGLFLFACDLNLIPESDLSDGVFWQSNDDFRQATNYLYKIVLDGVSTNNEQEYPLMADVMSDNAISQNYNVISNGAYLPSSSFGPWDRDYKIIRAANNILDKYKEYESESNPRLIAEAKFFRAYAYADLIRRYGDVPLIMRALDTKDEELYEPRTSRAIVTDSIYNDLDYGAANLPGASEMSDGEWGLVSKGAALALKSRVALREGTWNKFHQGGNFNTHLQIAKDAALQVIQSGEYQLYNLFGTESFRQLFTEVAEGPENPETIWAWPYGISFEVNIRNQNYWQHTTQGAAGISKSLVDDFLCTDGLPVEKSPLYQGRQYAYSEFENRDPRLHGTVMMPGDLFRTGIFFPNLTSLTGYQIYKYHEKPEGGSEGYSSDLMLIRYAEVLLNYAEATFELNNTISDDDLNISINVLRDRVEMPYLTNAFAVENGLNMQQEIRRERRIELGMEGFRYDDLLRWKIAETELPKAIYGVRLFAAEYVGADPSSTNLTQDSIVIVEPADKRSFDSSKQYLWPLPLNQIALNPNLKQNPNW